MYFWIGMYTQQGGAVLRVENGFRPGLGLCRLKDGKLENVYVDPNFVNPTYVIQNPDGRRLYVAHRGNGGGVAQLAIDVSPTEFTDDVDICKLRALCEKGVRRVVNRATGGEDPCHLTLSADGARLYTANYVSGSISMFPIRNGLLGDCAQVVQHEGHGANPQRQERAHMHHVSCVPGTELLCAVDLGIDRLRLYEYRADGRLHRKYELSVPEGYGPRHIAYSPEFEKNGIAYLCYEMGNAVSVLRRTMNAIADGEYFRIEQTLSTLPAGANLAANAAAAIKLSADGTRLYVSNRGYGATGSIPAGSNTIAEFEVLGDGMLEQRSIFEAGPFPRDFALLGDGSILVADQNFGLTLLNGKRETVAQLPMPGAVCVCPAVFDGNAQ